MDNMSRESEWQPAIRSARTEPAGTTVLGTRKIYSSEFMGLEVSNTYVANVAEENQRVVYETTPHSTIQATAAFTWEPVERGTKLTMSVEGRPTGVLRLIPRDLMERAYEKEIIETLRLLKSRMESEAGT